MTLTLSDGLTLLQEGTLALAQVEANGIRIDVPYLERMIKKTGNRIRKIEAGLRADPVFAKWRKAFGEKTNLGSRPQLAHVIFDVLGHKSKGRSEKSGRHKASEDSFDQVDLPFVREYLKNEKLKKLLSTYLKGVQREVVGERMHVFFHLAQGDREAGGAITYRGSSSDVNLQNQPIRDPIQGPIIRRAFIPSKGNIFAEIDYGAMEFAIAACFWRDPAMMAYASDESKDIHRDLAARLFLCNASEVSKAARSCAKNQNTFPTLYGSWWKKMAAGIWTYIEQNQVKIGPKGQEIPAKDWLAKKGVDRLGDCDPKEGPQNGTFEHVVKEVEEWFMGTFPVFAKKKEAWYDSYRKHCGFPLLTGFWCGGLYSKNFCMNAPIQGPAFHCLLWSLIQLQKWITRKGLTTKIVAQIHDCLLLDGPRSELQRVLTKARKIMVEDIRKVWDWVIISLKAEVDVVDEGKTWWDKRPYYCVDGIWQAVSKS